MSFILGGMEAQGPFFFGTILLALLLTILSVWWLQSRRKSRLLRTTTSANAGKTMLLNGAEGIEIHYVQEGKGKDILLLHGIGASIYTWRLLTPLLAKRFRVTVVDLPGFGKSTKNPRGDHGLEAQTNILLNFLDQLKIEKVHLVGSSMGGAIALWFAKHHPDRVSAVTVLAPATHPKLLPLNVTIFAKILHPSSNLLLTRTLFKQILKRVVSRHELINDEVVDEYLKPYLENGSAIQTFIRATAVLSDKRLPDALKGITTPVLILYGEKDQMVPKKVILELQKRLPHATLITHPSAGHHPHEDDPEWVVSQINHHQD